MCSITSSDSTIRGCGVESPGRIRNFQPFLNRPWKLGRTRSNIYVGGKNVGITIDLSNKLPRDMVSLQLVIKIALTNFISN